jgi:DNA-binding response OmpR family regulator
MIDRGFAREKVWTMKLESHAKSILVVDDEDTIREVVGRYLEYEGFKVCEAADGEAALAAYEKQPPDLIILDLMLPGVDGLTVLRRLRRDRPHVPVIMLTARGETNDRILGLDLGADDYVAKPFSPQELVSRVRAVLRRVADDDPVAQRGAPLEFDGLTLDPASRRVVADGEPVALSSLEFDLLYFLASHESQVFTRDQLLDNVWGHDFFGDPSTVTVHIRRLREKIEPDPSEPCHVLTVWGVGYRFEGGDPA